MKVIRIIVQVKPEEKDNFVKEMDSALAENRKFAGCLRFDLYADAFNEGAYMLYEEWDTNESFEAYKSSEHFAALGKKLFPLLAGKPDAAYYDAELPKP